jgi:hypothetical protein
MTGAQARLLPPSIPYRFFVAAGLFHICAWALVLTGAGQVTEFQGGAGIALAALHALTLGVFAMTAMGASFQILPVVTNSSLSTLWQPRLTSWLFIPGVGALIFGFATGHMMAMSVGGILVVAGLGLYIFVISSLLRHAKGFRVLTIHVRMAFVALAALAVIGLGMILDFMPTDRILTAAAHGGLAIYGFMGLLVMGFSAILVPMFALASPASEGRSLSILAAYVAGLAVAMFGAFTVQNEVAVIGCGLLLLSTVAHVQTMTELLKKGMKKKLGQSFVLIRTSWVLFPLSIALGIAAVSGVPFDQAMLTAGYVAVFGWLLTFVLGIQQQIMPFLAAMNVSKVGNVPPRLSQLAKGLPLKIHAVCHFIAIALVGIGIITNLEVFVQAGSVFGLVGAFSFLWFTLDVYRRMLAGSQEQSAQETGMPLKERSPI